MSYYEYLEREIQYIELFANLHNVPVAAACFIWVDLGLAELYAKKYWDFIINR